MVMEKVVDNAYKVLHVVIIISATDEKVNRSTDGEGYIDLVSITMDVLNLN